MVAGKATGDRQWPVTQAAMPRHESLHALLHRVRACTICADYLPLGPRPVLQAGSGARILIAGQAPGRKVHASGIPFDDASGQRLRDWLGLTPEQFYDPTQVAILPMVFVIPARGSRAMRLPARNVLRRGAHSCWRIYRVWPSPWCWVSTRSPGICPKSARA